MKRQNNYKKTLAKILAAVLIATIILSFSACSGSGSLKGKWKNIGSDSFGQIYQGSILVFDGTYCNLYSPRDTYAYRNGTLEINSFLFGEQLSFDVERISADQMVLRRGSIELVLERVS